MSPEMMTEETVAEAMRPITGFITTRSKAAEALARMNETEEDFSIVVAPETDKLLGVALRTALERACASQGHTPEECPIAQHLKVDIDFCFEGEALEDVLSDRRMEDGYISALERRRRRVRKALPIIVVDEKKVPVGLLYREDDAPAGSEAEDSDSAV